MIAGFVTGDLEAVVPIDLVGSDGARTAVDALVDSGFNGCLVLPPNAIRELGLRSTGSMRATLGDGSEVRMGVFDATVIWNGANRRVEVLQADGGPLVGMSLLEGHEVNIQVRTGGSVSIRNLA